ncbi:MAG: enoyl-CoA hydratase/isomerase family protein [Acidobacteriota bacterium]
MQSSFKTIHLEITHRVARIVLAQPPLNVLTIAMMKEIAAAVNQIGNLKDVCAIAFSAAPGSKAFSAGVSIEEHRPQLAYQMIEAFHAIFHELNSVSKPVVALVTGAALGGGCELVAFADIVIAGQSARFGQPEIRLGVFPPAACVMLPRIIGDKKAAELILTGELIGAEAARYYRLVNHVVADEEIEKKAEEIFDKLRQHSSVALQMTRRVLNATQNLGFEEAMKQAESVYLNDLMSCKDPAEGIEAYIAKRQPEWKHR